MLQLSRDSRVLFIGDSITDADWREDPEALGKGYVRAVREHLCARDPSNAPIVLNRGISGNKIGDLQKRWQRDVIELRPDVLSVFIGVNDVWHGLIPGREGTVPAVFEQVYRSLLRQTRELLPAVRIVLCEPSALWLTEPPDAHDQLRPYADIVRRVAAEHDVSALVPLYQAFTVARKAREDIAWTTDGVHPTSVGHALIARAWLQATGLI